MGIEEAVVASSEVVVEGGGGPTGYAITRAVPRSIEQGVRRQVLGQAGLQEGGQDVLPVGS